MGGFQGFQLLIARRCDLDALVRSIFVLCLMGMGCKVLVLSCGFEGVFVLVV